MIEFKNVTFGYEGCANVRNISFTVADGDFLAFVGTNGAGKSTISKLCMGLLKPDSGEVLIDGVPTTKLKTSAIAKKAGFLFQNPDRQICCQTVLEEVMFGPLRLGFGTEQARARAEEIIGSLGLDAAAETFSLSRGERQLVAIASVIVTEPKLLILDEPTTGLDYKECMHILGVIKSLNDKGVTVIMVCHDMEVVLDFAKRVIAVTDGRIVADCSVREMFTNTEAMQRASVIPPQIAQLAMRTGYSGVFNVDEFTDRLKAEKAVHRM